MKKKIDVVLFATNKYLTRLNLKNTVNYFLKTRVKKFRKNQKLHKTQTIAI